MRKRNHLVLKAFPVLLFLICTLNGCEKDKTIDKNTCILNAPSYNSGIKKIVDSNCSGITCHSGNPETFDFTTYEGIKEASGSIFNRINRKENDPLFMPKTGPMNPCDLDKLKVWINAGAPRN